MADESELRIEGDEFPPTSVRGVTESLEPIDNPLFDKYRLVISCADKNAPAFDALRVGVFRRTVNGGLVDLSGNGSIVTIQCISELAGKLTGSPLSYTPRRPVVPGSGREADGFYFYRPEMVFGLVSKSQETDEYGAVTQWEAEFVEI